jgi:hypothetical protein
MHNIEDVALRIILGIDVLIWLIGSAVYFLKSNRAAIEARKYGLIPYTILGVWSLFFKYRDKRYPESLRRKYIDSMRKYFLFSLLCALPVFFWAKFLRSEFH